MNKSPFTAVVAVRQNITPQTTRYRICTVPDGKCINQGDIVYVGHPGSSESVKAVCVSDTLFLEDKTLETMCIIANELHEDLPEVKGVVMIEWFSRCDTKGDG